jgi:hypothetical protein
VIIATGGTGPEGLIIGAITGVIISVITIIGRRRVANLNSELKPKNLLRREANRVAKLFEIDLPGELAAVAPGALVAGTIGMIYAVFATAYVGLGADSLYLKFVNHWAISGLVAAVICFVTANVVTPDRSIKTYETLVWSLRKVGRVFTEAYSLTGIVLFCALIVTIGIIPTGGWEFGIAVGIGVVLLFTYLLAMLSGLVSKEVETKAVPNQGIWNSLRNGLQIGFVTGIAFFIVLGAIGFLAGVPEKAINCGLVMFVVSGLAFAGGYGVYAFAQHVNLRHILYLSGHMPINYAKFLDFSVDHILMQRVGGGYIFIHRLLLEYLASLKSEKQPE